MRSSKSGRFSAGGGVFSGFGRMLVAGSVAGGLVLAGLVTGGLETRQATAAGTAAKIRGNSAITELKKRGAYDSFLKRVKDDKVIDTTAATAATAFGGSTKIQANDGTAGDQFGGAVGISGTTVIVGANANASSSNRNGSAYIYTLTGGSWTLQQKLTPADGEANDVFGTAVAISGDTAVVGAYGDTVGTNQGQGSIYIYTRSGSTWTLQQKISAADGAAFDYFGKSVAIAGDTVVVGAEEADISTSINQGAAYVFFRTGTTWAQQAKLTANDGGVIDIFGASVAISGDSVIVGASEEAVGANTQQGGAYVFTRSGTTWTQQAKLVATDGTPFDYFGFSVSIDGNTAAVGTLQDIGANFQQGSAYIFTRSGTTWTQQQKLVASDAAAGDSFGNAVFVLGDTVMIGAAGDTNGTNVRQGSAYLFNRSGTTWTQTQKLVATDGGIEDSFGAGVGFTNNHAIVGSIGDTIGSNTLQGSAYIFSSDVTIGGRVTTPSGQNLRNVVVSLIDSNGVRRTATTSSFGLYSFDQVRTGEQYTMTVTSKRYRFSPLVTSFAASVSNVDFVGQE